MEKNRKSPSKSTRVPKKETRIDGNFWGLDYRIPFIIEIGIHRRSMRDLWLIGNSKTPKVVKTAFIGILFGVVWGIIQMIGGYYSSPITFLNGIVWFLSPAFIEEFEFRSYYQTKLERIYNQKSALIIQSILFGLIHIPTDFFGAIWWNGGQDFIFSLITLGFQTIMGLLFGMIFLKTRSIWPAVISHFFFDFMIGFIYLFL